MIVRRLEGAGALSRYAEQVDRTIGIRLPAEYLARGGVYGLWDTEEIVGGFTIVTTPPFRSVLQLPEPDRARAARRIARLPGGALELNGLFLLPQVQDARAVLGFWSALADALRRSSASHMVFSYPVASVRLRRFYSVLRTHRLFEGEVLAIDGMRSADEERVELCAISEALRVLGGPQWLRARVRRRAPPTKTRPARLGGPLARAAP